MLYIQILSNAAAQVKQEFCLGQTPDIQGEENYDT